MRLRECAVRSRPQTKRAAQALRHLRFGPGAGELLPGLLQRSIGRSLCAEWPHPIRRLPPERGRTRWGPLSRESITHSRTNVRAAPVAHLRPPCRAIALGSHPTPTRTERTFEARITRARRAGTSQEWR